MSISKKVNQNPSLIPYRKIHSKWITYLNVECKAIKLLETDNMRQSLGSRTKQRILRLDTKSTIHLRKNLIN